MSPDDLHFLITRLNSVAGNLSNHVDGTKKLSTERAASEEAKIGEVVDKIREIYDQKLTDFEFLPDGSPRPHTIENIQLALAAKHWSDNIIEQLFSDYCRVFKILVKYGVESWRIENDTIKIVQDCSYSDCYETKTHYIPIAFLKAEGDERQRLMQETLQKKNDQKKEEKRLKDIGTMAEINELEHRLFVLKQTLS